MIISFSQLGNHGRLGNQLFQVASTLGMAEKYWASASFPEWKYEQYFETPIPHGEMQAERVTEKQFGFYDWQLSGDCDLFGYLQSEKYFGSTRLKLRESFVESCRSKVEGLFDKPVICMQIRRGDYVGNSNYFQIPIEWYIDTLLTNFLDWKNYHLLFVSDDIEYCRVHFECLPNAFFAGWSDIEDLALATLCDHFIISNSSFGWWCAWLGEQHAKSVGREAKVIHCGELHAGKLKGNSHADYYPERWIEFKRERHQIPLRDVTFTIPVFMDHSDRKQNFDLSLFMLMQSFDTNFIVMEQGGNRFQYSKQWAKYMQFDGTVFHRTKMLNQMCEAAKTPFLVNWDCDILIPPMQMLMAVEELRAGADMVFPYDGRFARMHRTAWLPKLQKYHDVGIAGNASLPGREEDHNSVGGAVMWNKDAFIDGGMENEYFISFGPEDCERHDRFKMLGYDIRRVKGSLFHLNHFVGVNSSPRNPHFKQNHVQIGLVRSMSREQLRDYVDSFPWRHPYTSRYYRTISEGSIRSAKIVMGELCEMFDVGREASVIDVGCGVGEWNNGNPNYFGLDFRVDKSRLLIPESHFIECNLEKEIYISPREFDLCLCLEVAEHLRPERAEALVDMLCGLSNRVLFSAAIPMQGGVGHVNEHWQSYWADLFWKNGFGCVWTTLSIEDNKDVEIWYRNNMLLFEKGAQHWPVEDSVLPEFYEQIVGHWKKQVESGK